MSTIKIPPSIIIPHSMNKSEKRAMHEYTNEVGEIIWCYNAVHAELLRIFSDLLDNNKGLGKAMLLSVKSDSAQRDIIKAFCEERFKRKDKIAKRNVVWIINAIGKLAAFRNLIAHSPMMVLHFSDGHYAVPNTWAILNKHEITLLEYRLEKKMASYKRDVIGLLKYAAEVRKILTRGPFATALAPKKMKAWPRKPQLRTVVMSKKDGGPKNRRARTKEP